MKKQQITKTTKVKQAKRVEKKDVVVKQRPIAAITIWENDATDVQTNIRFAPVVTMHLLDIISQMFKDAQMCGIDEEFVIPPAFERMVQSSQYDRRVFELLGQMRDMDENQLLEVEKVIARLRKGC